MKILGKINNKEKNKYPVKPEDIKNVIKLIEVAKDVKCFFDLCLELSVGEFICDSNTFHNIKLLKASKDNEERLVITVHESLMSIDTTIEVSKIVGVRFRTAYYGQGYEDDSNV